MERKMSTAQSEEEIDLQGVNEALVKVEKTITSATKEHNK